MLVRAHLRKILSDFALPPECNLGFVFADASRMQRGASEPEVIVRFLNRRAEWSTLLFGYHGLLESYFSRRLEIEGNLQTLIRAGIESELAMPNSLVTLRNRWHEFRFNNGSEERARRNARYHYGLPHAFFQLWLDRPSMTYSCAYWKDGTRTLEEAQYNKNEHICRKLRLAPGDRVADVGCGWGGFMFHAWQHHGTAVTGYNTTTEQIEALCTEIERRGLTPKLAVIERDFRKVEGPFDKVAHIGVLEHAGRDQLGDALNALADCMQPGGLGVLEFVGHVGRYDTDFLTRKDLFPGRWIPSLSETLELMDQCGLEVLDIENLRRHYALTMDAWAERFDRYWQQIQELDPLRFDESFRRRWRVYLLGAAESFRSTKGYTHLFEITFSKGNVGDDYPMSRGHLYVDTPTKRQAELAL